MATRENKIRFFLANTTDRDAVISWLGYENPAKGQSICVLPYTPTYPIGTSFKIYTSTGDSTINLTAVTDLATLEYKLNALSIDGDFIVNTDGENNYVYLNSTKVVLSQIEILGFYDLVVQPPTDDYDTTFAGIVSTTDFSIDWGDGNVIVYPSGLNNIHHFYSIAGTYNVVFSKTIFLEWNITHCPIIKVSDSFLVKFGLLSTFRLAFEGGVLQEYPNYTLLKSSDIDIGVHFGTPVIGGVSLPLLNIDSRVLHTFEALGLTGTWDYANDFVSDIWNRRYYFSTEIGKAVEIRHIIDTPIVVMPTGYVQGVSDGSPVTSGEKIYILVNQTTEDLITPKYNWVRFSIS